ncbi:MAG: LemA family protein [Candidatus Taylorbacteria bacterium]|nr:LemA family protein [Candidatus Taylorbacteria bacterium]
METTTILLIVVGLLVLWVIFAYNKLVSLTNHGKEAASDIEVQLKRRYDLIPNIINTVKGYATHEASTLEKVISARNSAMSAQGADKVKAEGELAGMLKSVFALAESYPDLKANSNFVELQRELSDTENKIQAARRFYNANARDLSIAIESFPTNFIAKSFGFTRLELFDLPDTDAAQQNIEVKF